MGPHSGRDGGVTAVVHDHAVARLFGAALPSLAKESGVRADVVPCRASDFREDQSTPNTLAYEANARGLLVYER